MSISNTAGYIEELRRRIAANKGKAKRARDRAMLARIMAHECEDAVRRDQREIESLGGKVRR